MSHWTHRLPDRRRKGGPQEAIVPYHHRCSALIQGSHAAYYAFSSITWQNAGFGGFAIAALWSIGVVAEIVVFAISPRFTLSPTVMVMIGAVSAVLRWIITAQEPRIEVLAVVQLMHGLTFGITQVGTVALMVRSVPHHMLASAQGYMVASQGAVTSLTMMLSGLIYARVGEGVYYAMAVMALAGGIVMAMSPETARYASRVVMDQVIPRRKRPADRPCCRRSAGLVAVLRQ